MPVQEYPHKAKRESAASKVEQADLQGAEHETME